MSLDPKVKKLLELIPALTINKISVEESRKMFKQLGPSAPKIDVGKVEDINIPGSETNINARVYFPKIKGPYGVLVYFHGGGFVLGDIETHDPLCREITNACNCVVVSVDYRLAPEHKFPAAVVDAYDATKWVYENLEKFDGKMGVAVGGDSAGGNLAAVVSVLSKGKINLKYQILAYPVVSIDFATRSLIEYSEGLFLTQNDMEWFGSQYLRSPADLLDIRYSPILYPDLSGLPPALVITGEYDPLRDQGEAYANKLLQAGVTVTSVRFNNVIHGFLSFFPLIEQGKHAIGLIGSVLRSSFYNQL